VHGGDFREGSATGPNGETSTETAGKTNKDEVSVDGIGHTFCSNFRKIGLRAHAGAPLLCKCIGKSERELDRHIMHYAKHKQMREKLEMSSEFTAEESGFTI
jgi:hypothetical protein